MKVVADAKGAASEGSHCSIGPVATHTALAGGNTATTAGGPGAVKVNGFGNYVTELASGRSSHGRGRVFTRISVGFSRGVFFLWGLHPHDGPMSDTG